jgi:mRNA interferase MazF
MENYAFPQRGDVFWVAMDPAIGSEIKKTRPGVVVSNDDNNIESPRVIIAPITSTTKRVYRFEVQIDHDALQGKAMLDQIRTVDKIRLLKKITHLDASIMDLIDDALKISLSLS